MITYELAKQLKDAGFPQIGDGTTEEKRASWDYNDIPIIRPDVYYPTLEELIEACEGYICLLKEDSQRWIAYWNYIPFAEPIGIGAIDTFMCRGENGKSAIEAVANLYISLAKNPV